MYGCFVVEPDDGSDRRRFLPQRRATRSACGDDRARHGGRSTRASSSVRKERTTSWTFRPRFTPGRYRERSAAVRFRNVPCLFSGGRRAEERTVDVAFGGAFYASVEERVEPGELPRLIELGRELKREVEACRRRPSARARASRRLRGDLLAGGGRAALTQRNVTVFADGEVDRSPCGSGTSARLALLDRSGRLPRRTSCPPRHRWLRVPRPGRG